MVPHCHTSHPSHRTLVLGALLSAGVLGALHAPFAPSAAAATDPVLSLEDLGAPEQVDLAGPTATTMTTSLSVPVPDGLVPESLRGVVDVPVAFRDGAIDLLQDGVSIGRGTLDPAESVSTGDGAVPVDIPLQDAVVAPGGLGKGGTLDLDLRTTFTPLDDGWCHDPLDAVTARLRDASVRFTGETRAPETLAEALPPVLRELTVAVPDGDEVTSAALETVTTVLSRYRGQLPEVRVVALDDDRRPGTDPDFSRRIEIPGDDGRGVTLEDPGTSDARIVLHGTGDDLMDQVRLLGDDAAALLDSTSAHAEGGEEVAVELPPSGQTVSELGGIVLDGSGYGSADVSFGIDQGDLGRLSESVTVHLTGSYTPTPADTGGDVAVAVNGTVVDRFAADTGGAFDRDVTVPDDVLDRYNEFTVTLSAAGLPGCGTASPLTLRVDGSSVVTSDPADSPTRLTTGFRAVPQALLPEVDVVLGSSDVADVNRAAQVLARVQSVTPARIRPVVAAPGTDTDRPLLIVDADGSLVPESYGDLDLPVRLDGTMLNVQDTGGAGSAEAVATDTVFGALQTTWDTTNGRMVLVASSTDRPELLDRLITSLSADRGAGFAELRGTAVVQQVDGPPTEIGVPGPGGEGGSADDGDEGVFGGISAVGVTVGIVGVVAAVGALFLGIVWSGRRAQKRAEDGLR
ncbi:hypothetical protein BJF89_17275 [Corynebacterium sp. CNJ-954]|uniref:hypothetical protein n=1 Tax=Corynebacterium sp. CNJ-954 TaxID=1904962 RepID=UPI000965E3D8|nr:hypothetical protein [Corynebacterium sp. CNJ-954]OLT54179.1 hypothetical protein BJF89_17275 [Corynebacterium sp. CNJ-954]